MGKLDELYTRAFQPTTEIEERLDREVMTLTTRLEVLEERLLRTQRQLLRVVGILTGTDEAEHIIRLCNSGD